MPDVLADIDANGDSTVGEYEKLSPGLKISPLIEDPIVGETHLMIDRFQFPVMDQGCRVINVILSINKAHQERDRFRGHDYLLETFQVGINKTGHQEKILGGVTGDCQFGEGKEVHTHLSSIVDVLDDLSRVSL